MSDNTLSSTVKAEWIKFHTVRSTILGVAVTFVLTIGLGALITWTVRSHYHEMNPLRKITFDPVSTSLGGTLFAQFAIGVIGVLFITSEYSSGSIRTTLAAVPNRLRLAVSKLIILIASMFVISEIAVFITFLLGQSIFSGVVPTASLSSGSVLRSVILAGVYLTLLAVFGYSLGLILRQSAACISVFTSILLILPIVMFLLPQSWQTSYSKYEPSALGQAMMSPTPASNSFGSATASLILISYVIVFLGVGVTLLQRRDA
ncbi:MAG: ABC transporter permease subunit [Acidimicrobiaceae bacterium]|nr:ABC transporter permease subunit [Acidimicrobiaceae bacterium]